MAFGFLRKHLIESFSLDSAHENIKTQSPRPLQIARIGVIEPPVTLKQGSSGVHQGVFPLVWGPEALVRAWQPP